MSVKSLARHTSGLEGTFYGARLKLNVLVVECPPIPVFFHVGLFNH